MLRSSPESEPLNNVLARYVLTVDRTRKRTARPIPTSTASDAEPEVLDRYRVAGKPSDFIAPLPYPGGGTSKIPCGMWYFSSQLKYGMSVAPSSYSTIFHRPCCFRSRAQIQSSKGSFWSVFVS